MAAQSFSSLSLDPPLVLFCPAKSSTTWPKIQKSGRFCVNVLGEGQASTCRAFSVSGGNKFANVAWSWDDGGLPVVEGCVAYVTCCLEEVHDAGDHEIAVASVQDLKLGCVDRPLLYYQGRYRQLLHDHTLDSGDQ